MATAMMVRHTSIGVAGRLVRIVFGMDFARTFECCGDWKLACMHHCRRDQGRQQKAKKEQTPAQHGAPIADNNLPVIGNSGQNHNAVLRLARSESKFLDLSCRLVRATRARFVADSSMAILGGRLVEVAPLSPSCVSLICAP